jgi:mono/diheme cytochrome c family protein
VAPELAEERPEIAPEPARMPVPDDARGGRLYDNWAAEKGLGDAFVPDAPATTELDGKGGPRGDGTLLDGHGQPLPNTGHDYRLKNLFGWDLRGTSGIYGPEYHARPYALDHDLLADRRSADELYAWFERGDERLPAYGAVLEPADLRDLVAFIVKMRDHELPQPADLFTLAKDAPKNYQLGPGGDPDRGKSYFRGRCADCHGNEGVSIRIDETESVGSLARKSGYEVWFKILNGHPGSEMDRQVEDGTAAERAQTILDVLAALCDRAEFPPQGDGNDVPDGDPRCGAYLK